MKIKYEIKINTGKFKGEIINTTIDIEIFDYYSLVDCLIERGYLDSYSNDNEFEVINRCLDIKN